VKELIAFGVWTESCVRDTIFDAICQGYRVWLVKDACGSGTDFMNRCGIMELGNRLYGGGVHSAENTLNPHSPDEMQFLASGVTILT
jgi:maleamate amidohydrolase